MGTWGKQLLFYIQGNKREAFENLLGGFHDRDKAKDACDHMHDVLSNDATSIYVHMYVLYIGMFCDSCNT